MTAYWLSHDNEITYEDTFNALMGDYKALQSRNEDHKGRLRFLRWELKDKSQHVVDLEAQLKRVTDDYLKYAEYHWVSANERPK